MVLKCTNVEKLSNKCKKTKRGSSFYNPRIKNTIYEYNDATTQQSFSSAFREQTINFNNILFWRDNLLQNVFTTTIGTQSNK